jgi:hypothetical protein
VILPLADEYQTTKTIEKANQFLAKKSKILGDKISSAQVIQNILQAELYRLDDYLDESIAIASRKCFERLVQHPKFKEITQETRLKIMTKRWKDMDEDYCVGDRPVHKLTVGPKCHELFAILYSIHANLSDDMFLLLYI